jgi:hypothetical protein
MALLIGYLTWVWNLVCHPKYGPWTLAVWKQGAEKNMWTQEGGSDRNMKKTAPWWAWHAMWGSHRRKCRDHNAFARDVMYTGSVSKIPATTMFRLLPLWSGDGSRKFLRNKTSLYPRRKWQYRQARTTHCCCSGEALDLYSTGTQIESRKWHRYPEICHGLPHFLQANARIEPQSGYNRFLPNPC